MMKTMNKFLVAVMLGMCVQVPAMAEQHALLIGVSDYRHERIEDLEGPLHDVAALQNILSNNWGVSAQNITSLVNETATERNIKSAFHELLDNSDSGDDILIYFSGHGTSIKDKNFGAMLNLPHTSGALVTHDFDPKKHIAKLQAGTPLGADNDGLLVGRYEIKPMLQKLSEDRTVLVIFDSCFSGNAVRSMSTKHTPIQKRLLNITLGSESEPEVRLGTTGASRCLNCDTEIEKVKKDKPFEYKNVIYFGAAADNQLAVDHSQAEIDAGLINTIDGKPHGGFSDALLRVLSNSTINDDQTISYRKLFNLVVSTFNVNCANCAHNPVLLSSNSSNVASKNVLSKSGSPTNHAQLLTLASFTNTGQKPELQIAALNLGEPISKAINLIDTIQLNTGRPDIELLLSGQTITAQSADGQLISTLPADIKPSRMTSWLATQAWLKSRKLKDAIHNAGTIQASFRNPLMNPVAFEGESVYFTVTLEEDAKFVVLVTNSLGQLSLLYPSNKRESSRVFEAKNTFKFPNRNDFNLTVVKPWGTDNLAIYALPPSSNLGEALLPLAKKADFKHSEPLLTGFTQALDSAQTQYSTAHIRFYTTQ